MDLFDMLDFVVGPLGLIALGGMLCRLDKLRYGKHKLSIIAMHGALACACGFAIAHAWTRDAAPIDLFSVVAALAWLRVSVYSWGKNKDVPPQFNRAHGPTH